MNQNVVTPGSSSTQKGREGDRAYLPYILLFAVVFVVGVWYVKWNPYYHKAFVAASQHSIGVSFISGKAAAPPAPSWSAAWSYAVSYFKAVWQAVVLGLLLGSLVQVLLPSNWIQKALGRTGFSNTALAAVMGIPSMMCTCCSAPVVVGLRKGKASAGAALSYWISNPVLNPATIVFMGFVLSWKFALMRIIAGVIMVLGIGYLANRFSKEQDIPEDIMPAQSSEVEQGNLFVRWLRALGPLILDTIPAYFIVVAILGAVRAWLFPEINPALGSSILVLIGLAIAGTLFVIPTAAEIPIVQSMMAFGLGAGPGAALLMTLPAVSLPSLLMIKRSFPTRVLMLVAGAVALCGIITGAVAMLVF